MEALQWVITAYCNKEEKGSLKMPSYCTYSLDYDICFTDNKCPYLGMELEEEAMIFTPEGGTDA